MTKFSPTERIGVHKVALIFLENFGWIEREQPISDFGIDMHVEIVRNQMPTGQIFALQIKSGRSYFSEESDKYITYRGKKKHMDYWLSQSLPVLIVLYNPETNNCYWEYVSSSKVVALDKGWKIKIPKANTLKNSKEKIEQFYVNPNHYTTIKVSDISHGGARRITAKILVESTQARSRFSMKNMITEIVEKFKASDYHRNDIVRKNHGNKSADIVFLFFYDGIQQVERGLTFCRVIWNDKNCKFPFTPFVPNDTVDDIEIVWDKDYAIFTDFIPNNEFSKGFYLGEANRLFEKSETLSEKIQVAKERYEQTSNYKELLNEILFMQPELDDLNNNKLSEGFPPLECQELDSLISSVRIFMNNIFIIAKDKERKERDVSYLINDYLKEVKEKLSFYKYERQKII